MSHYPRNVAARGTGYQYAEYTSQAEDRYLQYNIKLTIMGSDGYLCSTGSMTSSSNVELHAATRDEVPSKFERCHCHRFFFLFHEMLCAKQIKLWQTDMPIRRHTSMLHQSVTSVTPSPSAQAGSPVGAPAWGPGHAHMGSGVR